MDNSNSIELQESRHPVLENLLPRNQCIPNSLSLATDQAHIMILTGPNMAGKSVLMRQVALITLLAQAGSFIPAQVAKIGIVDRIFVRSGASDMISDGLSTFMVEMTETAHILKHATDKSLVIMDEIGRGTSTYDGISIAWSVAEFLAKLGTAHPRTLFATHYHELAELETEYPKQVVNYHLAVSRKNNQPIFLYQLTAGAAEHSFGIEVARLAGVPEIVSDRATTLLSKFEQKRADQQMPNPLQDHKSQTQPQTQLQPQSTPPNHSSQQQTQLISKLASLSIEQLTPLEALNILADLKKQSTVQ